MSTKFLISIISIIQIIYFFSDKIQENIKRNEINYVNTTLISSTNYYNIKKKNFHPSIEQKSIMIYTLDKKFHLFKKLYNETENNQKINDFQQSIYNSKTFLFNNKYGNFILIVKNKRIKINKILNYRNQIILQTVFNNQLINNYKVIGINTSINKEQIGILLQNILNKTVYYFLYISQENKVFKLDKIFVKSKYKITCFTLKKNMIIYASIMDLSKDFSILFKNKTNWEKKIFKNYNNNKYTLSYKFINEETFIHIYLIKNKNIISKNIDKIHINNFYERTILFSYEYPKNIKLNKKMIQSVKIWQNYVQIFDGELIKINIKNNKTKKVFKLSQKIEKIQKFNSFLIIKFEDNTELYFYNLKLKKFKKIDIIKDIEDLSIIFFDITPHLYLNCLFNDGSINHYILNSIGNFDEINLYILIIFRLLLTILLIFILLYPLKQLKLCMENIFNNN